MHNVGTVPTYKMHNVGTVSTYKTHNRAELCQTEIWIKLNCIKLKIEDVHENEDDLKMKAYLKNEDDQQNEVNQKNADNLKNEDDPQNGDM